MWREREREREIDRDRGRDRAKRERETEKAHPTLMHLPPKPQKLNPSKKAPEDLTVDGENFTPPYTLGIELGLGFRVEGFRVEGWKVSPQYSVPKQGQLRAPSGEE